MKQRLVTVVLGTVGALVASVSACSSDAPPGTVTDAGGTSDVVAPVVDGASPPDSAPPSNDAATADAPTIVDGSSCTGQNVKGSVASLFTSQGQPPPLPIGVTWEGCAGTAQAVAGSPFPTWTLAVSPADSYFRAMAPGYYTTLSSYVTGTVAGLVPSVFLYVVKSIPGFDAAKGHVIVVLSAVKASCGGTKEGSTVAAPGHPEAVISYIDKNGDSVAGSTAMDKDGFALVANLDPSVSADLKPVITVNGGACTVKTVGFSARAPVVANTVAVFQAQAD